MPPARPLGWRSPVLGVRGAGFLRPLLAVAAGLLLPALLSWALLTLAGPPGLLDSRGLRYEILFVLSALVGAPLVGFFLMPLLWAAALALLARGWAGLASIMATGLLIGLPVVHWALNGDLTTEAPSALPRLALAIALQCWLCWAVLWSLPGPRRAKAPGKAAPPASRG
ncbi:hypothetical protein [Ponticoccus litoralis]|uniref:Uncharacterized protein n=1 Tax=Ponticoccus litoralis TaxID=422297 RepID=A0AAW9SN73_9RHOB